MQKSDDIKLDTHTLKVFVAVYELNSVSRAAERFDVNQSTISYCLDKLRSYFGDQLFVKAGRGIIATDRAAFLVPKVRQLLADLEGMADIGQYSPDQNQAPLVVATNATELLPELKQLRSGIWAKAPDLAVKFLELGSRENIENLLEHSTADLVISAGMANYPPTLKYQPLFEDEPRVFYDPKQRGPIQSIEDYAASRHAVLDFGGHKKSTVELALEDQGLSRKVALYVSNAYVMAQMMKGTALVATMQQRLLHSAFKGFATSPVPFRMPNVVFDLIWHRRYDGTGRNMWLRRQIAQLPRRPALTGAEHAAG
ncbi:Transcriptional regulator, LysR family [Candidatus Rhodobacter oscarellae]|uniref:Transcriptional regulator, LysR family n=1 Tax=Candidatus Rhodobacter oscarellae TaxID=1675527 RepID=A0A0J9GWV8_9RHOB|nr:LysR family transcriptional regulator [Candidatus Rhodobacter lobularis]KMW58023.1 Transcriptional regulator, LysR family [Candidatus Rhodobacter lobularis]